MNRLFKKTLSLMLVIVMTVSLGVSAAAAGQTGAAQAEGPLGIVSAMSVELNALVEATKISKTEEIAGNTFYEGVLNGVDVVLVKAGIGKVLAASCAETLIDTYHVGGIVFTGIAGGVGDDVNVMDMVIATELVQHDYGTETNSGFEWNGEAGSNQETGMIPVDESLSKIAYDSACTVLGAEKVHQGRDRHRRPVHFQRVLCQGTSDQVQRTGLRDGGRFRGPRGGRVPCALRHSALHERQGRRHCP